jgi:hypothetical protein
LSKGGDSEWIAEMVPSVTKKLNEYLARAKGARVSADATSDLAKKAELLDLQQRWQRLADSYLVLEKADDCLTKLRVRRSRPSKVTAWSGVLTVTCPVTDKEYSTGILTDAAAADPLPQVLRMSRCPYCNIEHPWRTEDAKIIAVRPTDRASILGEAARLDEIFGLLVEAAVERSRSKSPRAAIYLANDKGTTLHHVAGMTPAYAACVDGFAIGPQSLACGLSAAIRRPVLTSDVVAEPRWEKWRWLAKAFDYRACWSFPIQTSDGNIAGTLAIYHVEPAAPTDRDLDLAALLTGTAAKFIDRRNGGTRLQLIR